MLSTSVGCSSLSGILSDSDGRFNLLKRFGAKKDHETDFKTPRSKVGIWKASTYEKAGAKSIRGFGGRFYFYDVNNDPVRVDGDLTIYGYDDDSQVEAGEGKADRKFVFKADSLNSHFSESAFGESYSFFVPWDNVGGVEKTITLIPVFKTVDGHMPEAKPATMRLPGRRGSKLAASDAEQSGEKNGGAVVQASVESPTGVSVGSSTISAIQKKKEARRMPTTLRLSNNLAERLSTPIQRKSITAPDRVEESSHEASSTGIENATVSNTIAGDKIKQTATVERSESRAPARVFGQPGAFR